MAKWAGAFYFRFCLLLLASFTFGVFYCLLLLYYFQPYFLSASCIIFMQYCFHLSILKSGAGRLHSAVEAARPKQAPESRRLHSNYRLYSGEREGRSNLARNNLQKLEPAIIFVLVWRVCPTLTSHRIKDCSKVRISSSLNTGALVLKIPDLESCRVF